MILPFVRPIWFSLPLKTECDNNPKTLFHSIHGIPEANLFITIGPTIVALWSVEPLCLLSFKERPLEFATRSDDDDGGEGVGRGGGYVGLYGWNLLNRVGVKIGSGDVDWFKISPSRALFPLSETAFSLGTPGFVLEYESTESQKSENIELNEPVKISGGLLVSTPHPQSISILGILDGNVLKHSYNGEVKPVVPFRHRPEETDWKQRLSYNPVHSILAVVVDGTVSFYRLHSMHLSIIGSASVLACDRICWSADGSCLAVIASAEGKISLFDPQASPETSIINLGKPVRDLIWSDYSIMVLLESSRNGAILAKIPFCRPALQSPAMPVYHDAMNLIISKGTALPPSMAWQIVSVPEGYLDGLRNGPIRMVTASPDGSWIAVAGQFGLCLHQHWPIQRWRLFADAAAEREFIVDHLCWIDNDRLAIICRSVLSAKGGSSTVCELRVISAADVLDPKRYLYSLELGQTVQWFGQSSGGGGAIHLLILYTDHVLHILHVSPKGLKFDLTFTLNASLSAVGRNSPSTTFPQRHWKISYLKEGDGAVVVFLRGDAVFLVNIVAVGVEGVVNASILEAGRVADYHVYRPFNDSPPWLLIFYGDGQSKVRILLLLRSFPCSSIKGPLIEALK